MSKKEIADAEPKKCGIVMPISAIDGCSEAHWGEVKRIIESSIAAAGFEGNLVSYADDIGVIQKRIVQNLYNNPMIVVDVSAKNPNVMFELGLRLAFDKPTIIIKDDKTSFSFDTASIEHLEYPRDLRYEAMVEFKANLTEKIIGTEKAAKDPNFSTFLKHFGEFKVAKIEETEVPGQELIMDELRGIRNLLESSTKKAITESSANERLEHVGLRLSIGSDAELLSYTFPKHVHPDSISHEMDAIKGIVSYEISGSSSGRHALAVIVPKSRSKEIREILEGLHKRLVE